MERSVRAAAGDPDFVPRIGAGLYFYCDCPVFTMAVRGATDFRDYSVEYFHRVRLYNGHYGAGGAREKAWVPGGGVWRGICGGPGAGRAAGSIQPAGAVLGGSRVEPGKFSLWIVCAAGIAAERKASK